MITGTRYQLAQAIAQQQAIAARMAREQSDIATGKRIETPSDDPAAAARVAQLTQMQSNESQWSSNVKSASAIASQADTTLSSVSTALTRARELMIAAANGTMNDTDREANATELRGIAQDIQSYQNVQDATGQPVFATGAALLVPIAADVQVSAAGSAQQVFGTVTVAGGGTKSLVDIINAAAAAIETTDPTARQTATAASLAEVVAAGDHIDAETAAQGVRETRLDNASDRLADLATSRKLELSDLQDTDLEATTMQFNQDKLSLDAAQAAFAQTHKSTLFDLLA